MNGSVILETQLTLVGHMTITRCLMYVRITFIIHTLLYRSTKFFNGCEEHTFQLPTQRVCDFRYSHCSLSWTSILVLFRWMISGETAFGSTQRFLDYI